VHRQHKFSGNAGYYSTARARILKEKSYQRAQRHKNSRGEFKSSPRKGLKVVSLAWKGRALCAAPWLNYATASWGKAKKKVLLPRECSREKEAATRGRERAEKDEMWASIRFWRDWPKPAAASTATLVIYYPRPSPAI
jgi:hypothetical protein